MLRYLTYYLHSLHIYWHMFIPQRRRYSGLHIHSILIIVCGHNVTEILDMSIVCGWNLTTFQRQDLLPSSGRMGNCWFSERRSNEFVNLHSSNVYFTKMLKTAVFRDMMSCSSVGTKLHYVIFFVHSHEDFTSHTQYICAQYCIQWNRSRLATFSSMQSRQVYAGGHLMKTTLWKLNCALSLVWMYSSEDRGR
jgi:hypothetical protein